MTVSHLMHADVALRGPVLQDTYYKARLQIWSMQVHFEAKHPKLTYEVDKVVDMHALMGGTTQGVAIRGSTKK